jgi:hypothetical protein
MRAPPTFATRASQRCWFGWLLLGGCLVFNLAAAAIGWDHTILDTMSFRQCHTALSARFMLGHHYRVLYETPVFGPPWSIPHEFPLYQWTVAALSTTTGYPLDQSGRLVNRVFFLLSLFPCYSVLRLLGLPLWSRLVTLCLLLVSPFYLFWSRTFMMESTALFFSLCFLACCVAFAKSPRLATGLGALVLGILAALAKVTTFAGPVLVVAFLLLWLAARYLRGSLSGRDLALRGGTLILLAAIPTACAFGWTHLADEQMWQNPLAVYLTSANLHEWHYGKPGMRFEKATWDVLLDRMTLVLSPWVPGPSWLTFWSYWLLLAATAPGLGRAWRRGLMVLCCLAIFFTLPFVFTNLHWVHEYYAFATNVFLIGALGIGLASLHEGGRVLRIVGYCLLVTLLVLAPLGFWYTYVPVQMIDGGESIAASAATNQCTDAEDVIVVLGDDFCSEVPYYSGRRALMITVWDTVDWDHFSRYVGLLDGYRIGALVVHRYNSNGDKLTSDKHFATAEQALRERGYVIQLYFQDASYEVYRVSPKEEAR